MSKHASQMHLAAMLDATGHHVAGWRLAAARAGSESFALAREIAATAERARFDFLFLADSLFTSPQSPPASLFRLEPLTLLSALAACTTHIGLGATASTTYNEPYHVARAFASLDQISGGRAAWNVVTTAQPKTALNFGHAEHPPHAERYAIAAEFVEVVKGLWDSWEEGGLVRDKGSGQFADFGKMHRLDHKGRHFSVEGPLNLPRSPQGQPVIIQAGASAEGRDLAASVGEVIFTVQHVMDVSRRFASDLRRDAARFGRDPASLKIMPGVCPIVGTSLADAKAQMAELGGFMDPVSGLKVLSDRIGHDLSSYPLDGPLPELPQSGMMQGHAVALTKLARMHGMTIRELRDYAASGMGHRLLLGTPEQIADGLEEWFVADAADGFAIICPWFTGAFDRFADEVVPILQRRGLFRSEYGGPTLRDHLGLPAPVHPAALAD